MKRFLKAVLFALVLIAGGRSGEGKEMPPDNPEPVMQAVIRAMLAGDQPGLEKHTLPHPQRALLLKNAPRGGDEPNRLMEETRELKFRQVRNYRLNGRPVQAAASGYPVGTTARFMAPVHGTLTVITVVKTAEEWKVDLRWWIEMIEMARRDSISKESPEYVIKSFVLALLRLNKTEARKFVTPETDMSMVFAGAPPYAEPSDQLPMLAIEMPLVEALPEESYLLPSGQIARGSEKPDERKVLVGLFGPTEMVFEVIKVKTEWKVIGLSYFRLLNQ